MIRNSVQQEEVEEEEVHVFFSSIGLRHFHWDKLEERVVVVVVVAV